MSEALRHAELLDPNGFLWAVGIEDTFIPQPSRVTGRVLDEYELLQHYEQWREDLDRISELGIRAIRYGVPWYRVNPEPGRFDWHWTDRVIDHLVEGLNIKPIIDLVHYGTPLWLQRQFFDPSYPERVAEYAAAFARRYRDLVQLYTPLNEPIIHAYMCGRARYWPPYGRGERGYVRLLLAVVRGLSLTVQAIRAERPDSVIVHVEASEALSSEQPELTATWHRSRSHQFLPTDLLLGIVDENHELVPWLLARGANEGEIDWFRSHAQSIDVMGLNFYPTVSAYTLVARPGRKPQRCRRRGTGKDVEDLLGQFWQRYGVPVMLSETSDEGTPQRRISWMDESVLAVRNARASGIPVVGYTWWPAFTMVRWSYRNGTRPLRAYWIPAALWDVTERHGRLERVWTPVVDHYRGVIHQGIESIREVGPLPERRSLGREWTGLELA